MMIRNSRTGDMAQIYVLVLYRYDEYDPGHDTKTGSASALDEMMTGFRHQLYSPAVSLVGSNEAQACDEKHWSAATTPQRRADP